MNWDETIQYLLENDGVNGEFVTPGEGSNLEMELITYLHEVFGYTQIEDVDDLTMQNLRENAKEGFAFDILLVARYDYLRQIKEEERLSFQEWLKTFTPN